MLRRIADRLQAVFYKPWRDKLNCLEVAIDFSIANNILGDYLEFGVYRGQSFAHAYRFHRRRFDRYRVANASKAQHPFQRQQVRFFAFDSFQGLPATSDSEVPIHWTGQSAMACSKAQFLRNIRRKGVDDLNDVVAVEGFYEDSLRDELARKHRMAKAAVVHIDCDLYASTVAVLDFITPFVIDGTVIVFDDFFYYRGHPKKGERGAFNRWLSIHPQFSSTELYKAPPAACFIISQSV